MLAAVDDLARNVHSKSLSKYFPWKVLAILLGSHFRGQKYDSIYIAIFVHIISDMNLGPASHLDTRLTNAVLVKTRSSVFFLFSQFSTTFESIMAKQNKNTAKTFFASSKEIFRAVQATASLTSGW